MRHLIALFVIGVIMAAVGCSGSTATKPIVTSMGSGPGPKDVATPPAIQKDKAPPGKDR